MLFLNDEHMINFEMLTSQVFPASRNDKEYKVMVYVLSLPEIYRRCYDDEMFREYPFLWAVTYTKKMDIQIDEDTEEEIIVDDFEVERDEDGKDIPSKKYGELSHGYQDMFKLGQHLFNSSHNEFNLCNAFIV